MTFQNLFIEHPRSAEEEKWLKTEIAEQEARYQGIAKAMDDLAPQRDIWYEEFFDRIQTRGFSVDGDLRKKIPHEDLPIKPNRPHKVVY